MPHPTIASTPAPFAPQLHDLRTTELVDEVGGTRFEVWIPEGARRARVSPREILVALQGQLMMAISRTADVAFESEAARWRGSGALVLRAEQLPDGFLVTAIGDRSLDVVRLARSAEVALRVHVHVLLRRRFTWQPQSCAEALCASLQIVRDDAPAAR